jgi:arylsulfatase A-like enzyme
MLRFASISPFAIWLVTWVASPTVLRIVLLLQRGPRRLAARVAIATSGLCQDAGVAAVALAALGAFASLGVPEWGLRTAAVLLFWLVQTDAHVDHLLYAQLGTRLQPSLVGLSDARSLRASAWRLGLARALAASASILAVGVFASRLWPLEHSFGEGVSAVSGAVGLCAVVLGSMPLAPRNRYWASPIIVLQLRALFASWRGEGDRAADPDEPAVRSKTGDLTITVRPEGRPHLLVIFMESFRARDVGALGARSGVTPNFDEWARRGLLFCDHYANGVQSVAALVSALYGVLPRLSITANRARPVGLPLRGLPHVLAAAGYRTAFWHGGDLAFQDVGAFLGAHGFDELVGEAELKKARPEATGSTSWGIDDEHVFSWAAARLGELDRAGTPTFGVVFTLTNHHPWRAPKSHVAPSFEHLPRSDDTYRAFLRTMHYSDACLGRFMQELEARGLLDKSIVVIVGDHGQPMGERDGNYQTWGQLHEEGLHVPLLIVAPGRVTPGRIDGVVGSHIDLSPTFVDLLGLEQHGIGGASLLRDVDERVAFAGNPFGGGWLGMRRGRYKLVLRPDVERPQLFDVEIDPHEEIDLAGDDPVRARNMEMECRQTFRRSERFYSAARLPSE